MKVATMNFPLNRSGEHERAILAPTPGSAKVPRHAAENSSVLASEVATFNTDGCGFISAWPISAEHLFGYESADIIGKHIAVLYCDADLKCGRVTYELLAADSHGHYSATGWQKRKNGQQFWATSENTRSASGFQIKMREVHIANS